MHYWKSIFRYLKFNMSGATIIVMFAQAESPVQQVVTSMEGWKTEWRARKRLYERGARGTMYAVMSSSSGPTTIGRSSVSWLYAQLRDLHLTPPVYVRIRIAVSLIERHAKIFKLQSSCLDDFSRIPIVVEVCQWHRLNSSQVVKAIAGI